MAKGTERIIMKDISKLKDRREIIEHVLEDLVSLNGDDPHLGYAIKENVDFFKVVASIRNYIVWVIKKAPKLKREQLLELTDLPFPHWDQKMHFKLIELEKRKFPGLIEPLVRKIYRFIHEETKRLLILVDFGFGGMEVERQVIERLTENPSDKKLVFIGFDKSSITHEIAKQNLYEFQQTIITEEIEKLTPKILQEVIQSTGNKIVVILAKNNIFRLDKLFARESFDVIFHSLFKHHLGTNEKTLIDKICVSLSKNVFEYDGYKSWFYILFPHTITGWHDPVFLNATIFSDLRYFTKQELKRMNKDTWRLTFSIRGTYLREYH